MKTSAFAVIPAAVVWLAITLCASSFVFADAEKIFRENSKTVVVVLTYDENDNLIAQGSGFIVRADGAVVTNYHVVSNARKIKVKAGDRVLQVEGFIYIAKENDIVILKAQGSNLPVAKLGDDTKAVIGEKVFVISSPQGLENTISDGILSGMREISETIKILQITAPVSPGSSGGPVFNNNGEVLGIATFILKEAQNLNFAMPVNLIKQNLANEKITAFNEAKIEDYKNSAEYWFYRGIAKGELDDYSGAIQDFSKSIELNPKNVNSYYNRGIVKGELGDYRGSIQDYNKAIELDPKYADAYINRGIAKGKLDDHLGAILDFSKAIELNPKDAEAHYNRGITKGELGDKQGAIQDFNKAIELKPKFAAAYINRGTVKGKLDDHRGAIQDYNKAIELNPKFAEAYINRGTAKGKLGDYRGAILDCSKAIELNLKSAEAYYNRGTSKYKLGNMEDACLDWSKAGELGDEKAYDIINKFCK